MALICAQAVDSFTTTGTGQVTLANAVPANTPNGFNSEKPTTFTNALGGAAISYPVLSVFYYATDGTNFELGLGNLTSATNFQRVNVLWSSNAGQLVAWAAGTKTIYSNPNLILGNEGSWQRQVFSALPENTIVEGQVTLTATQGTAGTPVLCYYKVDNAGKVLLTIPSNLTSAGAGTAVVISGLPAFLTNVTTLKINPCAVIVSTVLELGAFAVIPNANPALGGTITVYITPAALTLTTTTGVANGLSAGDLSWSLM